MPILDYWKEFLAVISILTAYFGGRESKKAQTRKEIAIAHQEEIKTKKEEVDLSSMIQGVYKKMIDDFTSRLSELEKASEDLTKKYGEILLRNAILEERAETYEQKYKTLEKEHIKLKSENEKIHIENREIRKELNELKNNAS